MLKTRKWQELYLFVKNVFSYYIIYEMFSISFKVIKRWLQRLIIFVFEKYCQNQEIEIRSGPSKKKHRFDHLYEFVARKTKRIKHHGYNNDNNIGELMKYM